MASALAARRAAAKFVLVTPFDSMAPVAQSHYLATRALVAARALDGDAGYARALAEFMH